jgi:hypothetical protein
VARVAKKGFGPALGQRMRRGSSVTRRDGGEDLIPEGLMGEQYPGRTLPLPFQLASHPDTELQACEVGGSPPNGVIGIGEEE